MGRGTIGAAWESAEHCSANATRTPKQEQGAHAARPNQRVRVLAFVPAQAGEWHEVFGEPPKTARQRRALPAPLRLVCDTAALRK